MLQRLLAHVQLDGLCPRVYVDHCAHIVAHHATWSPLGHDNKVCLAAHEARSDFSDNDGVFPGYDGVYATRVEDMTLTLIRLLF